jgi:hypothetical protein
MIKFDTLLTSLFYILRYENLIFFDKYSSTSVYLLIDFAML